MSRPSRTKVVIYDCDGVLFDSRQANEAFFNLILSHFGMPPLEPEQLDFVHASTSKEAVDYLFRSNPLREQAQAYRQTIDYRPLFPLMKMEPGLRQVLKRLRTSYGTAMATNRSFTMPLVLKHFELEELFDLVVTSLDVSEPKPHPESLWKILRHFNAVPEEAVFVGDSEVDQLMSQRAGVPFVAYKNPALKADYHIQQHVDIFKVLGLRPASI